MLELLASHDESLIDWSHIDWHTKTLSPSPLPASCGVESCQLLNGRGSHKFSVGWSRAEQVVLKVIVLLSIQYLWSDYSPWLVLWEGWERGEKTLNLTVLAALAGLAVLHDCMTCRQDRHQLSWEVWREDYYQSSTQCNAPSQDYTGTHYWTVDSRYLDLIKTKSTLWYSN